MTRIHHYHLEETLCENAFVQVFRAFEKKGQKKGDKLFTFSLVNKNYEINPRILMRMISDGDKTNLTHPHIAKIIDFGEFEGQQYFVSDYIGSKTLSSFLGQPVSPAFALDVISQLASALHFLSLHGYIHGNIHPTNIFFDAYGNVILSALELVPKQNREGSGENKQNGIIYTHYHSPEFIEAGQVDEVSDLYGIGVLLFEMLTGEYFDVDKYIVDSADNTVNQMIPYLPQDNFGFQPVINKLLAKNPKQRYQNGLQLVDALNEYDSRLSGIDEINLSVEFDGNVSHDAEKSFTDAIEAEEKAIISESDESKQKDVGSKHLQIPRLDLDSSFHAHGGSDSFFSLEGLRNFVSDVRVGDNYRYVVGGGAVIFLMVLLILLPVQDNTELVVNDTLATFTPAAARLTENASAEVPPVVTSKDKAPSASVANNDKRQVEALLLSSDGIAQAKINMMPPLISKFDVQDAKLLAIEVSAKVDSFLLRAKDYLKKLKFTTPKGENAYEMYLSVLEIDPDNRAAKEGIAHIAENYAYMAKQQITEQHYRKALHYIRMGLVVDETNALLNSLRAEVTQIIKVADTPKSLGSDSKAFAFDGVFE